MKKIHLIALILIAGATSGILSSCRMHCVRGSGNQVTINRKVGAFTKLEVSDSFKVLVKQDSTTSTINITADDNLMKYIKTSVENGVLHIYTRKNMCNSGEMVIRVPMRIVEGLKASDGAEITADGKLNGQEVYLTVSDGAKITAELTAKNVITHTSDEAELDLKGQSSTNDIQLSDGSKIYAKDFVSGSSTIHASDGSYIELNVLNDLNVRASDGAVIKYKGTTNVNTSKSDGASVEKLN